MLKAITVRSMCYAIAALCTLPALADELATKAMAAFKQQKYEQAEDCFKQICEAEPSNERAHYYLALCLSKLKKEDLAKEELSFIVNSFPGTKEAEYSATLLKKIISTEHSAIESKPVQPQEKPVEKSTTDRDYEAAVAQAAEIRKSAKTRAQFYINSANQQSQEMKEVVRGRAFPHRVYSDSDIDAANADFKSQAQRIIDDGDREAEEILRRAQLRRDAGPH